MGMAPREITKTAGKETLLSAQCSANWIEPRLFSCSLIRSPWAFSFSRTCSLFTWHTQCNQKPLLQDLICKDCSLLQFRVINGSFWTFFTPSICSYLAYLGRKWCHLTDQGYTNPTLTCTLSKHSNTMATNNSRWINSGRKQRCVCGEREQSVLVPEFVNPL